MKLTFLGTGTSFGVPQVGCTCAVCASADPHDKRLRSAAFIETDTGERLLIDTPPELRLQLLAARIDDVDAVLYTHEHADHLHGIDDIRAFTIKHRGPLPLYGGPETLRTIRTRFPYILEDPASLIPGTSKPNGRNVVVTPGVAFSVGATEILPLAVPHGNTENIAYRIGALGFVTDAKAIPDDVAQALQGVDTLVLNALWWRPHPTHLSVPEAIAAAERIGARITYLTHLTHDNFHAALERDLPASVRPAYDGLTITI